MFLIFAHRLGSQEATRHTRGSRRWLPTRITAGICAALLLHATTASAAWVVDPVPTEPRRDPILFVHGWRGESAQWRVMLDRFRADGWTERELFAWTYDPRESNVATAARIAARVDQILVATGAERVDVITHSMGALSSRYYLRNLQSAGKVDAWVSLGGPNHGTAVALLCSSPACREMRPGSAFLATLNTGAAVPDGVRAATWSSHCDEAIEPTESTALEGAANHRTACLSHMALLRDTAVYRQVRDFVARPPAGE